MKRQVFVNEIEIERSELNLRITFQCRFIDKNHLLLKSIAANPKFHSCHLLKHLSPLIRVLNFHT